MVAGLMWGEHGRHSKFVPYEPSLRIPLWLRWPGHISAGTNTSRTVSYLDLLPTMLQAAGVTLPTNAPRLDGESLLGPSSRTVMFSEYYLDSANGGVPTWKMVRTATVKYIQTYDATGAVIFREYYDLVADPIENQPSARRQHRKRPVDITDQHPHEPAEQPRHVRGRGLCAVRAAPSVAD